MSQVWKLLAQLDVTLATKLVCKVLQMPQQGGYEVPATICRFVLGSTKCSLASRLTACKDVLQVTTGARVALRNDSYALHLLLPTKVDPLVSLMKVEKVPDSTYDMIGGLDQQIKEIKEVCTPAMRAFQALSTP
jgi:ATP-dependent 26S proteasome regulatory subunit